MKRSISFFAASLLFAGTLTTSCNSNKGAEDVKPELDDTLPIVTTVEKSLIVPKIEIDSKNIEAVAKKLSTLQANAVDVVNWEKEYPSKPEVSFRIAHNGDNVMVQYDVHENEIMAEITEDKGDVWTDSAVEFFISFDNAHYYNAEFNCIGKALMGYKAFGTDTAFQASSEILNTIERLPSLGTKILKKQQGDFHWTLTFVIPHTAFLESDIKTFDGLVARGNFYKCGDNLTNPHFVSWTHIDTPTPSFHQPKFFGEIVFEK